MERNCPPPAEVRRSRNYVASRVTDLERSQQWTSLASDIDDLERAKMRHHVTSDLRKHMLHRRSMPEPERDSLIYVDANNDDYGTGSSFENKSIADNYFLPICSESVDGSVDSWSWKPECEYSAERNYFKNNNYECYDYNVADGSRADDNRPIVDRRETIDRRNIYNENSHRANVRDDTEGSLLRRHLIAKERPYVDAEETAYRGSREKLHEIFRRNRDLRRQFFADVPANNTAKAYPELKSDLTGSASRGGQTLQEIGSGYGSVETLTSQSNNSEISAIQSSSRASQNSRASELASENGVRIPEVNALQEVDKNFEYSSVANDAPRFREPATLLIRDKNEGQCYYGVPERTKNLADDGDPSKCDPRTRDLEGVGSPDPPPLPKSEPPSSISGHQLLISDISSTASVPPSISATRLAGSLERPNSKERTLENTELLRDRTNYEDESEGLRMLDRFEAHINNRKSSPLISLPTKEPPHQISKNVYKSMPDLANSNISVMIAQKGVISRLAVNGSTIDLNLRRDDRRGSKSVLCPSDNEPTPVKNEEKYSPKFHPAEVQRSTVSRLREPEEIHATRIDLSKKSKLGDRRGKVPPPLDLSRVGEALRQEVVRQDRRVLRDYTVENSPLHVGAELLKCKLTVLDGPSGIRDLNVKRNSNSPPRPEAALKTATNLLELSRDLSRPVVPVRSTSGKNNINDNNNNINRNNDVVNAREREVSEETNKYRSSVVVWCDGGVEKECNSVVDVPNTERILTKKSTLRDHRKSAGSLIPSTGNVFPSVYAPIPYKSPRRYVEGEVTIHYRSPVRTEAKEVLTEAELARRSAENMRRVYQEERRRKYLQELHDIDSRRHTDNFTPSQKSPIPLNRYDDFVDDLSHRSRSQEQTPEPRLVAKALYNFVGQSSRELTFRRGDIIFVRRQVDKNWYEGEHNAMIGLFPFNYVEILPYDGIRTATPKKPYEGQARAKFNFVAQTTHELSLVKGDLVVLTRRVDQNWYEGRIGNRKGIFPISYVEVLVEPGVIRSETPAQNKPVAAPAAHSLLSNGSAGGKLSMGPHHYTPSIPTNTNAAQAHYNSLPRMGGTKLHVAPVNETLHIDTHSEPLRYRALYNYRPQNDDELELREGDSVYVMEKCDDGWFVGSSQRTGCFGTFPGNYVERL